MALAFGNLKTAALRTRQWAVSQLKLLCVYLFPDVIVAIDLDTFY